MEYDMKKLNKIRIITIDGKDWFIGKDVVEALGYNLSGKHVASEYIKAHCEPEDYVLLDKNSPVNWMSIFDYKQLGQRGGYLVNERGLYKLITYSKNVSVMEKEKIIEWFKEIELSFSSREENELLDNSTENKNEMMVFNNEMFGSVRVVNIGDEAWFAGKDVVEALGYTLSKSHTYSEYLNKYVDEEDMLFLDKNVQFKQGVSFDYKQLGQRGGYLVNETGLLKLITYNEIISIKQRENIINFFKNFGMLNGVVFNSRKEIEFIDKLERALLAFNVTGNKQHNVLNYRIDYYIPSLNVAIEYDENGHKDYTYEAHELRQELIEKELGCRFIRVTDEKNDEFNIGLVIKELFNIK